MPKSLTLSRSLHSSCSIYPKVEFRTVSQHHTEQPRQWIASRHVTANKGEVIIITTNWMVEVSRTRLLAHIYNFFLKISFRTMVILTRSTSTRSNQHRYSLAASQHRIVIVHTSVLVTLIEDANPINLLLRHQQNVRISMIHHLRHTAST